MARGFKVADAFVEISTDLDQLRKGIKDIPGQIGPSADRAGQDVGGKLSQGIRLSVVRNSPLIAAAVAGGLAAGAPVALAGATTLFAGIGAIAAAQTVAVRSAWTEMGKGIRDAAVADSAVLVPVFVGMADQIGAAFQRLRPQMRDAFEAAAPQIQTFTDSLVRMAENAMPGLVRAVQSAGPVVSGFGSFLEATGTGLTGFFDAISGHAPAAGQAFRALGDIMGELLPLLGELLGQGAELAVIVLPPLADVLGVVADAAGALGPVLPAIAAGFLAMRVATSVATGIGALATQLTDFSSVSGKAATSAGLLSRALPAVGLAMAGIAIQQSDNTDRIERYTEALLRGGEAAEKVRAEVEAQANAGFMEKIRQAFTFDDEHDIEANFAAAEEAARELGAANEELESTYQGVSAAMLEVANQALAAANSHFAYEQAIDSTSDSLNAYNAAVGEFGAGSEEASDAARALSMDMLAQAEAAGRAAQENSGLGDSLEGQQVAASATLAELYRLRTEMGSNFPPALQNAINGLEASGAAVGGVTAQSSIAAGTVRNLIGTMLNLGGQRPTPVVSLVDYSTARAQGIIATLARINSKTVTITTNHVANYANNQVAFRQLGGAIGGIVHAYAEGGFEPMQGGIAQVVKPNTWRVIGDRVVDDEAYIPINDDRRSREILTQTANRMGFGLMPMADGGLTGIRQESPAMPPSSYAAPSAAGAVGLSRANIQVTIATPLNMMNDRDVKRAATLLRAEIIKLERAQS